MSAIQFKILCRPSQNFRLFKCMADYQVAVVMQYPAHYRSSGNVVNDILRTQWRVTHRTHPALPQDALVHLLLSDSVGVLQMSAPCSLALFFLLSRHH